MEIKIRSVGLTFYWRDKPLFCSMQPEPVSELKKSFEDCGPQHLITDSVCNDLLLAISSEILSNESLSNSNAHVKALIENCKTNIV